MRIGVALVALSSLIAQPVFAQALTPEAPLVGGVFVPIKTVVASSLDGKCVDVSKYYVSINIAQLQIQRSTSWITSLFSASKSLGAKLDVSLRRMDGTDAPKPFSRSINLNAEKVGNSLFLAPIKNVKTMEKYDLTPKGVEYSGIGIAFYFVQTDQGSPEFKVFQSLVKVTGALPLPANPYAEGLKMAGDLTQEIFSSNVADGQTGNPDAIMDATLATNEEQANDAGCAESGLVAGAQAVVYPFQGNVAGLHVLPLGDLGKYCYWKPGGGARIVYYKKTGACADSPPDAAVPLDNPLIAFAVNTWRKPGTGVGQSPPIPASPGSKGTTTVTGADVTAFATIDSNKATIGGLDLSHIAKLAQALVGKSPLSKSELKSTLDSSSPVEQEAALALGRCKALGIDPAECR
ncbi:hypothetical protein GCM10009087_02430 [Sphingomonas oligophenolica]